MTMPERTFSKQPFLPFFLQIFGFYHEENDDIYISISLCVHSRCSLHIHTPQRSVYSHPDIVRTYGMV